MDLSIIIVNYNTKDLLHDCLVSISKTVKKLVYETIIVDNNSSDGSPGMVRDLFPSVELICNSANVGFSRANNQGYSHSRGECLLFLNSDTLAIDCAIEKMVDYLNSHPKVGVVGPKILNSTEQPTRSYMRFLDIKKLFWGSKRLRLFVDVDKHRIHFPTYDYDSTRRTEWLSGACLMIKRDVFRQTGLFDEGYFLYLEDMDLCLQVRGLGYDVVYLPAAEIIHLFGGSSKGGNGKLNQAYRDSMGHYFKKNFPISHYWMARIYLTFFHPS